jgi:hypothetical protein
MGATAIALGGAAAITVAASGSEQTPQSSAAGQAEPSQPAVQGQGQAAAPVATSQGGPAPIAATKVPDPVSVKLKEKAQTEPAVSARLVSLDVVKAEGRGRGELSGDAYAVTVEFTNGSSRPLDLGAVVVTLDAADGTPASPVRGDPHSQPMKGRLPAGKATTGTYLFSMPRTNDTGVRVSFTYAAEAPTAIFSGDASEL